MFELLFANGRVVDVVIAFMALEALALVIIRRRSMAGSSTWDIVATLAAGLCLLLALRAALTGMAWPWIATCLIASLVAHLTDLRRRGWI